MMLEIRDLSVVFTDRGEEKPFTAGDKSSLQMDRGEIVGIMGESGSGKSMTAHALMGLIRRSQVSVSGSALFEGTDLLSLSREELRRYQGRDLSIIFQEPMTSRSPCASTGGCPRRSERPGPWRPWLWRACPTPRGCTGSTLTSCPAACASG